MTKIFSIRSRVKRQNGFTLLETLLAVTLFAIVISSSYGIFSMGIQIWKRSQGRSLVERKATLALERMGQDVRNAIFTVSSGEAGLSQAEPEFTGNEKSFSLPAIVNVSDKKGIGMNQYGAVMYEWNSAGELCRRTKSATDLYLRRDSGCRVLAQGIKKLKFEYLLYQKITKSLSWYNSWDLKDGMPQAVRVNLELEEKMKGERRGIVKKYQRTFLVPVAENPVNEGGGTNA